MSTNNDKIYNKWIEGFENEIVFCYCRVKIPTYLITQYHCLKDKKYDSYGSLNNNLKAHYYY